MAFDKKPPRTGARKPSTGRAGPGRATGSRSEGPRKSYAGKSTASRGEYSDRPKRDYSDRPKRDFGDRPPRGEYSDRPKRDFGDRPKRDFGDRPPRGEYSDRPKRDYSDRPKRDFGDRPPRGDYADRPKRDFGDRPKRDFGDRPPRGDYADRQKRDYSDRPKRDFGDRPPRGDYADRPKRDFGDRPKRDFGDRPPHGEYSDRPKRDYSDRPKRDFGDRAPRGEYGDRPKRTYTSRAATSRDEATAGDDAAEPMQGHEFVFYGIHAVQAALKNASRKIVKLWVTAKGEEHLEGSYDEARHPAPESLDKRELERRVPPGAVHQGIAVAVEPLAETFLSDVLSAANLPGAERHVVVILDEVTDPHNVGAVLRSMSVFGAKAMIVHKRNAPGVTGVMAKTATGALEHIPMIPVVNLGGAIQELKNAGFFCLGLDENADYPLSGAPVDGHIALVLGAEGEGLREKTRSLCDAVANIPALGDIQSLNVSNAAAIALYAVTQKTA